MKRLLNFILDLFKEDRCDCLLKGSCNDWKDDYCDKCKYYVKAKRGWRI